MRATAASAMAGDGNYAVGSGTWLPKAPSPPAAPPSRRRRDSQKRASPPSGRGGRGGRGGRAGARRKGRGSPIMDAVLRKMHRLESSATLEDVDAILGGKRLSNRDYTTVLAALKARRAWRVALRVGEWMRREQATALTTGREAPEIPNRAHYQVMLGACAASGEAQAAQTVADEMAAGGIPIDATALGTLILANERAGEWATTLSLLDKLEGALTAAAAAAAAAAEGAAPRATPLPHADELPPQPAGVVPLSSFFGPDGADADGGGSDSGGGGGGGSSGEGHVSSETRANGGTGGESGGPAAQAEPRGRADAGDLTPTSAADPLAFAYASVIRAHEAAGKWQTALKLFERCLERGVAADAHCYSAALGACRRAGQAERALALMARAKVEGHVTPNGIMYTLAMAACNAGHNWEGCLELLAERRATLGLDAYAYSVALGACAQGRQWERALELLDEMELDESARGNSFAWNNAMVACNRGAQPERTLELYDRMRAGASALSDHSIAAALVACRNTTDWQRAQAVYDGARAITASSVMCTDVLLDVLAACGEWTLVLSYFDAMREAGAAPTANSYERAIEACDRVDADRALALFEEMRTAGL